MTKEREQENMLKEIKKISIDMLDRMTAEYSAEEVDRALKYSIENKELIDSFDKESKTIEELYNKYVTGNDVFYPAIPISAIAMDKENIDFDELKSMILNANIDTIFEVLESTKGLPMLPEEKIEENIMKLTLGVVDSTLSTLKGGK